MSGVELLDVNAHVWAILRDDALLGALIGGTGDGMRAYLGHAPKDAAFPLVIYGPQPGSETDVNGVGGARIFSSCIYVAKAVVQSANPDDASAVASRLDTLLHQAAGVVGDSTVLSIIRDGPLMYSETIDGVTYEHVGGRYRVWAHSL